nr:MAG TPA: hypothetical protein [Caudoviricetes sp.]
MRWGISWGVLSGCLGWFGQGLPVCNCFAKRCCFPIPPFFVIFCLNARCKTKYTIRPHNQHFFVQFRQLIFHAYPFGLFGAGLPAFPFVLCTKAAVFVAHSFRLRVGWIQFSHPRLKRGAFFLDLFGCHSFSFLFSKKSLIRCPIQRITGTAILFPIALYLGASGHCSAGFRATDADSMPLHRLP